MNICRNDLIKLALFYSVDPDDLSDEDLIYEIGRQLEDIEINDPIPTFNDYNHLSLEEAKRNKMLDLAEYYCIKDADKMSNDEIQQEITNESDKIFFLDFYHLKYKRDGKNIDRDLWLYNRALKRMTSEIKKFKFREIKRYKRIQTLIGINGPAKFDAILTSISKYKDISESVGNDYKTISDISKDYGLSRNEFFHNVYDKIIKYYSKK